MKFFVTLIVLMSCSAAGAQQDVLTQRNNNARTGTYLAEVLLTPASVSSGKFGRLYTQRVSGQIAAQPLYARAIATTSGSRNLVFVATRENFVYAFDADRPADGAIWRAGPKPSTGAALIGAPPDVALEMAQRCRQTRSVVGITSTPVIDAASNTLYVVSRESKAPAYHIHAIDIRTGAPRLGVTDRVIPDKEGYSATINLNRPGLLLANGVLYLGFAALNCDNLSKPFHGYVMAYRAADLVQLAVLNTTPGPQGDGGGVWQSGNGLAADADGNVYFFTGNGTNSRDHVAGRSAAVKANCASSPDAPLDEHGQPRAMPQPVDALNNLGDSIVKVHLDATAGALKILAYFTVGTWNALSYGDTDLGSGGPVLLPDGYLTGGGKEGRLYVLDQRTMTPVLQPAPPNPATATDPEGLQAFWYTYWPGRFKDVYACSQQWAPNIHGSPAFWVDSLGKGHLYTMPEKDYLRAYTYDFGTHRLAAGVLGKLRSPDGMPGAQVSVSANGSNNGVLWLSFPQYDANLTIAPGLLVAVDAMTLKELWRDDSEVSYAKFVPPTIADGKVFRATFGNELIVYGLGGTRPAPGCETRDIGTKYDSYAGANGLGLIRAKGICPQRNCSYAFFDTYESIYSDVDNNGKRTGHGDRYAEYAVIYTSPATCAHVVRHGIETKWGTVKWRNPGKDGLQWENGPLGLPTTDERVGLSGEIGNMIDGLRQRRYNLFEHGAVYAEKGNPPHADPSTVNGNTFFAVFNDRLADGTVAPIYDKYASLGGLEGILGAPTGDTSPTPDDGRFAYFNGGAIYWSRTTGSHVIWGAILAEWIKHDFERGYGYPTSDENPWPGQLGGRSQFFQRARLCWYPKAPAAFVCSR